MKLSCLLLIYLTHILLRASAYVFISGDVFLTPYRLAGFLAILLLSLRKRRPLTVFITVANSTTSITTAPQLRCNDGYTLYPGPGRSFCFRYVNDFNSWDDARRVCQMESAELTVLDDESLPLFGDVLKQQLAAGGVVWLGAKTDDMRVARYVGGGGQSIPQNSPLWVIGEPSTPNNCIVLGFDRSRSRILDETCDTIISYVCQQF